MAGFFVLGSLSIYLHNFSRLPNTLCLGQQHLLALVDPALSADSSPKKNLSNNCCFVQ